VALSDFSYVRSSLSLASVYREGSPLPSPFRFFYRKVPVNLKLFWGCESVQRFLFSPPYFVYLTDNPHRLGRTSPISVSSP